jgi:methionyl-tRNA synthetase
VERRLVTAALPYINNIPHLGHIVGSHLPADIFARYCRLKGYDVLLIGGSDENGTPSELAAESLGVEIKVFLDKIYQEHKRIYEWFCISYDNFSRTSREIHHKTTQEFFKRIYENGFITKGKLKTFYCEKDKRFLPDRYVEGTCPKCGYEHANADQCEKCTALLDAEHLLNPKCKICGSTPIIKESEHLFLRLDKLSDKLEKWLKQNKHWRPQVTNLALGWIKEGLKPRCITRDLKHGVRVPIEGFEDKVFYVWFDAPIGYISSTKEKTKDWEKYWKDKKTKIYHFLGKDNIPFHTIFWPAMLMANGEFNLPYQVVGLQYLNYEGGKFSKSQKRGVFCEKLPESGINVDVMRAYLTFLIPEVADTEFKWSDFQARINSDVIGNYGNFINRVLSFIYHKLGNSIERPASSELTSSDKEFIKTIKERVKKIGDYLENIQLRNAFREILKLATVGNKYFNENEPWHLIKKDIKRANDVLYLCANLCRTLSIVSEPYLPNTAQKIWKQLNLEGSVDEPGIWDSAAEIALPESHSINKPSILFNKLTDEYIEELKKTVSDARELKSYFE